MKVVYKQDIFEKIAEASEKAALENKEIEEIILNEDEARQLWFKTKFYRPHSYQTLSEFMKELKTGGCVCYGHRVRLEA